ncbi:zinc finger BED domain-containing protein 6-like [Antedon mediterranea]|uniref:zinc finger BED domain-containing protein 6-like n=1 Tax=Antedon mediterranea TaxID=105859 RepID=UPI003AF9ADC5
MFNNINMEALSSMGILPNNMDIVSKKSESNAAIPTKAKIFEHYSTEGSSVSMGNFKAQCKHCLLFISASTKTTSNLLTHLKRRHTDQYAAYLSSCNKSLQPINRSRPKFRTPVTQSERQMITHKSSGMMSQKDSFYRAMDTSNMRISNNVTPDGISISNVSRQVMISEVASTATLPAADNPSTNISNYVSPYMQRMYQSNPMTSGTSTTQSLHISSVNGESRQPRISQTNNMPESKEHPKNSLADAAVYLLAENLLPLRVLETDSFKEFVKIINVSCTLPSESELASKHIPNKQAEIQTNIIQKLNNILSVCITFDMWSHRNYSFVGMTIQFISEWKAYTALLVCKRSQVSFTNEEILQIYQETLYDFNLTDKIENVTTGGTFNEMKSLKVELAGFEGSTDCFEGDSNTESNNIYHFNPDQFIVIPERLPSFAKTLQLCVLDGMGDLGEVKVVLAKACSILNALEGSDISEELLATRPITEKSNIVQWNHQLKKLKWLLSLPENIKSAGLQHMLLTAADQALLQEFIEVLEPFEDATDYILKSSTASVGYVIPCIRGLQHFLQTARVNYVSKLVQQLNQSTITWFASYQFNETYLLAAVLDPRFKCNWCQENDLIKCMQLLEEKGTQINSCFPNGVTIKTEETDSETTPSKKRKLFDFMTEGPDKASGSSVSLTQEIKSYINASNVSLNTSTLDYWNQNKDTYPTLAKIAQNVLCIPAISSEAEVMFESAAQIQQQKDYQTMSDETFENLMFLHCNMKTFASSS